MLKALSTTLKYFLIAFVAVLVAVYISACSSFGKLPDLSDDKVTEKFERSPQWDGQYFKNTLAQEPVDRWKAARAFFLASNPNTEPDPALEVDATDANIYAQAPASGLRVTWLGHSILLLEIDDKRILIDPVWSERASPFSFMGAKRFYPSPLAFEDLPDIDAVLISHDHYDHLDMETVKRLKEQDLNWYVPLGVGSHLRYWGVNEDKIYEMDWWQQQTLGDVTISSIPSRHSSGRTLSGREHKKTLWSGWAINGPEHSVVYSGDTSMHPDFAEVGKRLGPFDLSIIEIGAYNPLWRDNHLGPEQAFIAHQLLQAKAMLPVHWAGFNLSRHAWTAPIERLLMAADESNSDSRIIIPKPGQAFEPSQPPENQRWWPSIPWDGVETEPVWSSKVDDLLEAYRKR
ncbi:MBL fold metallo-hydrolase [Pseudoteredinibacter isoporae]|uniref:MBL fold metallo-hydrolase n=1 Tax=Pseudoteredinibacter isoporae TaxID=570281 RepID=UPI00310A3DB1